MSLVTGLIASTIGSSLIGASSAKKAANAQRDAANQANETQRYIFDRNVELTEPWRNTGQNALGALAFEAGIGPRPTFGGAAGGNALTITENPGSPGFSGGGGWTGVGAHPSAEDGGSQFRPRGRAGSLSDIFSPTPSTFSVDGQNFDTREAAQAYIDSQQQANPGFEYEGFTASPGYQFRLDQGMKGIENMAAARGLRLSGSTLRDAADFNSGLASQEYGNYWNRLAGLSGVGQSAVNTQVNAGTNFANASNQNTLAGGAAQASGYMGVNNALQGGFNNMFNIFGMKQAGFI